MSTRTQGVSPSELEDDDLRQELEQLYQTREDTFLNGSEQALEEHTHRMFELEKEYLERFPRETRPAAQRTREGARSHETVPGTKSKPQESTTRPNA